MTALATHQQGVSSFNMTANVPYPCSSLPPAAGLRAHVELARISGHIVCNTYRVAPFDHIPGGAARHVERAQSMLDGWLAALPPTLQMPADQLSPDPACCLLHMAHNQVSFFGPSPPWPLSPFSLPPTRVRRLLHSLPCYYRPITPFLDGNA